MTVTYDDWPNEAMSKPPKNVVEATLSTCSQHPTRIVQVKTYKTIDAAKTGITILEKARATNPERFDGAWRWVPALLTEPVDVDGVTHVAEIRAMYTPEEAK